MSPPPAEDSETRSKSFFLVFFTLLPLSLSLDLTFPLALPLTERLDLLSLGVSSFGRDRLFARRLRLVALVLGALVAFFFLSWLCWIAWY